MFLEPKSNDTKLYDISEKSLEISRKKTRTRSHFKVEKDRSKDSCSQLLVKFYNKKTSNYSEISQTISKLLRKINIK